MNTPPMLSGKAGVIVTLHSPAVEENSTGPSGPWTVNESDRVRARRGEAHERRPGEVQLLGRPSR